MNLISFYKKCKLREKTILILIFVLFSFCCDAQSSQTMDQIDILYQSCLDKGIDMLGCSKAYYLKMDSMLNVVYKQHSGKIKSFFAI